MTFSFRPRTSVRRLPWLLGAVLLTAVGGPARADDASPLDEPLRLLAEAKSSYEKVTDYTCTLVKKERIDGELTPENVVAMSVRTGPFGVDLRWLRPTNLAGQEACYVDGKNDGKMRVRSAGLLGAVGFISLDPTDARCQKASRHSITEAGIGNMIAQFADHWESERKGNATQVHIGEFEYNKRRCVRVETLHPTNPDKQFIAHRTVVYFDKESRLPIRMELYDWPHGADDRGELIESVSFANLRLNVGLSDDVFSH